MIVDTKGIIERENQQGAKIFHPLQAELTGKCHVPKLAVAIEYFTFMAVPQCPLSPLGGNDCDGDALLAAKNSLSILYH
ncbi:MAG: hypothetical protein ACWGOX_04730 [Desulforhopalus sp.]